MIWVYLAATIFGGGFIIPALLGGLDFETDVDLDSGGAGFDLDGLDADFDVDADMDADVDADADTDDALPRQVSTGIGDWVASLLTFRSLTFVAAFFGLAGMVFTWLGYSAALTFVSALVLGIFAGLANGRLMAYLKRSDMGGRIDEHHFRGAIARVVLPVGDDRRGRVELDVGGQPVFMVAKPYRAGNEDIDHGHSVVVVEVNEGTAYVMSAPELEAR